MSCLWILVFAAALPVVLALMASATGMKVREEQKRLSAATLTFAFVALVMTAWLMATNGVTIEDRMVPPIILPSPFEVIQVFPRLHFEQALVRSAFDSFIRVGMGFSLAALIAIPLGVYMASFPRIEAFFKPLELVGAYVPIVVFVPLTLAWFGIGEAQKVGFLFIACFVALLPLVVKSIANVPKAYLDVAATKGASQRQLVWKVLFPVAMSDIYDHMRGVYGIGWGWIILAEVVNAEKGLGYLISISERRGQTYAMFAVIIVIVSIAVVCDWTWRRIGELLFPYRSR